MKRLIAVLLLIVSMLALWGCSQAEQPADPVVDACKNAAQQHIDSGDVQSAIAVLEEGYAMTNDPSIQSMLEQLKASVSTQPEEGMQGTDATIDREASESTDPTGETASNADAFLGSWSSSSCKMEISCEADILTLHMMCISYRAVEFDLTLTAAVSSVEGNKLVFPFTDDGIGNKGSVVLYSDADTLNYVIADYVAANDYGIQMSYGGGSLTRSQSNPEDEVTGSYDDLVGYYEDVQGANLQMWIYYEDSSKEVALAEIALPGPLGIVTVTLDSAREGDVFWGTYFEDMSSEPACTVEFHVTPVGNISANIEYWLDTGLYEAYYIYQPAE